MFLRTYSSHLPSDPAIVLTRDEPPRGDLRRFQLLPRQPTPPGHHPAIEEPVRSHPIWGFGPGPAGPSCPRGRYGRRTHPTAQSQFPPGPPPAIGRQTRTMKDPILTKSQRGTVCYRSIAQLPATRTSSTRNMSGYTPSGCQPACTKGPGRVEPSLNDTTGNGSRSLPTRN